MKRRNFLYIGAGTVVGAAGFGWYKFTKKPPLGFERSEATVALGREFLNKYLCIDIHAHPGRSFVENAKHLSTKLKLYSAIGSFEEATIDKLVQGSVTATSFSTVADFQLLDLVGKGLKATREFNEGEAWDSYQTQLKTLKSVLDNPNIAAILKPNDIVKAKKNNKVGALFTTEGADFLEGKIERVDQVYDDGFRSMTLVHYHINEIGDIQTEPPHHNGLSNFGKSVVKKMNQKGMLIDLAHAARATSMQAMELTEKPVMISHSAVRHPNFDSKRFINLEEGKRLAETGGIIGAWPAGLGGLLSMEDYIEQIFRLIDDIGIAHVAMGTDMDANYKPVFDDYSLTPLLVGRLLEKGMSETETAQVIGGNFMRVFKQVSEI